VNVFQRSDKERDEGTHDGRCLIDIESELQKKKQQSKKLASTKPKDCASTRNVFIQKYYFSMFENLDYLMDQNKPLNLQII
jgi:hypothetical protein